MERIIAEFFKHIKKNKYLYGLLFSLVTVIVVMTQGLQFANIIKDDYTLRMISYGLFILTYLIYIGVKRK